MKTKTILAVAMTLLPLVPAMAQSFGANDVTRIVDASQNNEMKFSRDYKGKTFSASLRFEGASTELFSKTKYQVNFEDGVYCSGFKDEAVLGAMADWSKGQHVAVTGTITDTVLGNLWLEGCALKAN